MISRQETAKLLDCSDQTVTDWVNKGLLKGHVVGRKLMFDRDCVEQYFDDLKELNAMGLQISDLKSEYRKVIETYKELLAEARGLSITSARARDAFRANQLALVSLCDGYLTNRESAIFSALIRGEKPGDLSRLYRMSLERVVQISIEAAHKLSHIEDLKETNEQNKSLKAENERLSKLISKRDEQLNEYQSRKNVTLKFFEKRLENFNLSMRTMNGLRTKNCKTIADLVRLDRGEVMNARNFGKRCMSEVEELFSNYGLHWGMDPELMTAEELMKWSEYE